MKRIILAAVAIIMLVLVVSVVPAYAQGRVYNYSDYPTLGIVIDGVSMIITFKKDVRKSDVQVFYNPATKTFGVDFRRVEEHGIDGLLWCQADGGCWNIDGTPYVPKYRMTISHERRIFRTFERCAWALDGSAKVAVWWQDGKRGDEGEDIVFNLN